MSFLVDAATYYKGESHQKAAWEVLEGQIDPSDLEDFKVAYRAKKEPPKTNPLDVPYFLQLDNESGTGYRECFSSSCAMLAGFFGKVSSDDEYNLIRERYGDTTDTQAQLATLDSFGLNPDFRTTGSYGSIKAEIDLGRPVAVGWLHKGPVSSPNGGGHWSVIKGYHDNCLIFNDPNGEADLVYGGYVNSTKGEGVHYSLKNWLPRWEVEGSGTGWYLVCQPR